MKQLFISILVLVIITTFLIFVKVQTLSMSINSVVSPISDKERLEAIDKGKLNEELARKELEERLRIEVDTRKKAESIRRLYDNSKKDIPSSTDVIDQLKDSAIAYNSPKDAILDEPFNIVLRIDPTATVEQLKQMMPNVPGEIIATQIRTSQIIRAELTVDDTEFRLVNLSPNEQALFVSEPNIWEWELTALKSGKNHITISITALVHIGDHETNHFITAYSDDIIVTSTTKQQIKSLYDKHKDKLWGLLVVPAFEWIRRRFNKWREDRQHKKEE